MKREKISFTLCNTSKKLKPSPLFDIIETDKKQLPTAQVVNQGNTSPRACQNNTITSNYKTITQRTIESLMSLDDAEKASVEEIRKVIKNTKALGIVDENIYPLRLILGKKEGANYEEILFLAKHYYYCGEFFNSCSCLKRIEALHLHSLDQETKIKLFEEIVNCYEKVDNYSSEAILHYLNEILSLIDSKSRKAINIYKKLFDLYIETNDFSGMVYIYKQLLSTPLFPESNKNTAFEELLDLTIAAEEKLEIIFLKLYELSLELKNFDLNENSVNVYLSKIIDKINECIDNNALNIDEKIKGFNFLIEIYKNNKNTNAIFQLHDRIRALPDLINENKANILFGITEDYLLNNYIEKSIEYSSHYCNFILDNCAFNKDEKFNFLIKLARLHLNYQNMEESVNIYKKSRSLRIWDRPLIKDFLKSPQIGFEPYLLRIEQMKPEIEEYFLKVLACHPAFWHGPLKLADSQLEKIFQAEINEETVTYEFIANLFFAQYLTVSQETYSVTANCPKFYLNQKSFFSTNPNILTWNILPQREETITADIFSALVDDCINISKDLNYDKKNEIDKYLYLCINSKYSDVNFDFIVRRVVSIIDVLKSYSSELTNNESLSITEKETIQKILLSVIDIMCDGSKKCQDLAIATLTDIENFLKLAKFPQYQAQILLNMFKLWAIQHKLTDNNQVEQTQTYLYCTLQLNSVLGLSLSEKSIDEAMLYPDHAFLIPQEEALSLLATMFSATTLIDFTSSLSIFNILFEKEKNEALNEVENDYLNSYDLEENEETKNLRVQLAEKRRILIDNFYRNKAIQIFSEAFFLLSETD